MACRISELVLKCCDPKMLARFWCEVLDFIELDREEEGCIEIGPREGCGGPQPTIFLIRNDEPPPRPTLTALARTIDLGVVALSMPGAARSALIRSPNAALRAGMIKFFCLPFTTSIKVSPG
jgi:hypothetical protein